MTRVRLQQGTPEPVLRGPAPLLLRGTTEGARCRDCPFSKDGQAQRPVVGEGIADPDWIIVGEGPGRNEVALNHPFVGASGQLVNKALDAIGCRRNRLFITNATLCLPTPDATDEDKHKARKCCAPRFVLEMAKYPGKPVLALGNVATQAFLGSGVGISAISGSYHQVDRDGTGLRVVIPTLHPAAILRGGAGVGGAHAPDLAFWNLMYDAAKINSIAAGKDIVFREDDIYIEWQDPKRAEELIRAIVQEARRERMVAVDTETYVDDEGRHSALQPLNAKLSAIGLATTNWGMSVAWNVVTPVGHRLLAAVMADPNVRKIMHNCLTGDSRVWLADGSRVRLEKLVKYRHPGPVLCLNETTGEYEAKRVVDWVKAPIREWKDWLRIRMRGKGCLRLTCDHEVLTTKGRMRADQVRVGDAIYSWLPTLNAAQEALIYGSLLGDASIQKNANRPRELGLSRSPRIVFSHDIDTQDAYAQFKARLLGDLFSGSAECRNDRGFSKPDGRLREVWSRRDARLAEAWQSCRPEGPRQPEGPKQITQAWLKNLTIAALALWYCDDGHLQTTNATICVETFEGRGIKLLISYLKKKGWPIKEWVRKDGQHYLRISGPCRRGMSPEMERFWRSLAPYIPRCMRRKLPERYWHLIDDAAWQKLSGPSETAWADEVVEVGPLLRKKGTKGRYQGYTARGRRGLAQYCLVVEDNHNFFAEGLAVSNCLYDRPVLRRHRMPVFGPCDDTLLKHHNAFPGLAHGLQRVATQYFAIAPWKSEFKRGNDTIENLTIYNSRDTLVTARLDEPLDVAIEHTRSRRTYEIDLLCADAAEWMYDVGIPISREVNQKLYDQFWTNMQKARKGIEDKANEPEIREKLWDRLAFEQAKRCRHGSQTRPDSENYIDRQIRRLEEIRKAHAADKWEWKIGSADHLGPLLQIHGLQLDKTSKGKLQITLDVLKPHRDDPIVKALYEYRKDKKNEAAKKIVEDAAARLDIRDELWKGIAFEQAKRIRQPGGTPADPEDFEERQKVRLKEIEEAYEKGKWFWKIGSSDHIAAYLKARGVPMYFQTDKGATSTKKEILEGFAHLPEVRSLIDFRENQKMFSTFVYSFFDRHDEEGKLIKWGHAVKYGPETYRLHPRWNVHRITGRWSAEDPTVMNWPKADKKKGRPNLRSQVVAPEGRALVGFDFCLAAGTQVDTPNGSINIEDIEPGQLVYSYDFEQRRPRCRRVARRARTGLRATLKVILDNGAEVRCTPEHRWYVRPWGIGSGAVEVEASDLRPGMRLLPLRRSVVGPKGSEYETLYSYSAFEYVKTHIAVAEAAFGPRPVGYHVHHKNEDQFDNRPENLKYKPAGQHASEHSSVTTKRQWADPEIRARMQHGISASIAARGGYHGTNNPRYGERSGEVGHCPNCGAETYLGGKRPRRFCNRTCYNEFRAKNRGLPRGTVWHDLNHKVVAIVDDGLVVPTYDIEVEDDHNFALSIGVFVHNSQLEARVIALLSSDPFLCEIFHSGKDIHSEFARIVWPDYDELPYERRKVLRDSIKRPEYGAFFGGRVETLWQNIKKDYPDVQLADIARMVSLMTAKMPGVAVWHQQLLREVAKPPHEIRSAIYGRRRCFPLGNADINDVYNFPVQCGKFDQRVLTTSGLVPYQDLTPTRHTLVQPSGRATSSFTLHDSGVQTVYEIQTKNHTVICTAGHRFLVLGADGHTVSWIPLRELQWGAFGNQIAVVYSLMRQRFERVLNTTKEAAPAQTFDVEIHSNDHGYIVEGLVTHNSTGADIMATGLIALMPKLRRDYHNAAPIIQIHDAIVFECDEGDAPRLQKDVQECFEQTHTHNDVTIHFPVDPTTGRSWADV